MWLVGLLLLLLVILLPKAVYILMEFERGVVFRLGRYAGNRGPGVVFLIPWVDRLVRVSLRTIVFEVPPQDVITRDNVSVKVNAVVFFRIIEPGLAIIEVENYLYATGQLAQVTLRSVLGHSELDELLSQRERLNLKLQDILDRATDPWGIKVSDVEVKTVDLSPDFQRVMAKQAEAERERRAKVINAEGEFLAAAKLAEAATIMEGAPYALQLRFLQTLNTVSSEKNSVCIIPFPVDILGALLPADEGGAPSPED